MTMKSSTTNIQLDNLTIDPRVQRILDTNRVEGIAAKFDHHALGTITISKRGDGTHVILDGNHRVSSARVVGYKGNVHAHVYTGLTLEQEAKMFLTLNNTKQVSSLDKFRVRVTAGDAVAVTIDRILHDHGWHVASGVSDGTFRSVVSIERAYLAGGTNGTFLVERILRTLTEAWGHKGDAQHQAIIDGLSLLFIRYGQDVDSAKLIREMQSDTPRRLAAQAKARKEAVGGTVGKAMGAILRQLHNKKRTTNALPEWK